MIAKRAILIPLCLLGVGNVFGPPLQSARAAPPPGAAHERSADMDTIHRLFGENRKILRTVKKLTDGVETITESSDPKVQALLRQHVHAMHARLRKDQPIRAWDPLFADLFKHASKIKMEAFSAPRGIRTRLTSADAPTVRLLHAHANAVTGFIKQGAAGMADRHESPLAKPAKTAAKATFLGKGDGVKSCPVTGEPIVPGVKATIGGRVVLFCCESCVDVVKKDPARYLKPRPR
jgi:hypothetical protein